MPIEEGWKRSSVPISGDTLENIEEGIVEASQWSPNKTQCASVVFILDADDTFTV